MPEHTPDPSRAEALSPAEAVTLLHALRDRLVDDAAGAFSEQMQAVRADLAQLAARARDSSRRQLYESGHALLANGGLRLLRHFRGSFCRACEQAIAQLTGNDRDTWEEEHELSLVDANAFERDLAIARLSAKAGYACSQQLTALDRRVAALLGRQRLESDRDPFSVKLLFTAFADGAEASWAGGQLSLILLETFEHYTSDRLPDIYRSLNTYLVEQGVLPKLPVEVDAREHELDRPHRGDSSDSSSGSSETIDDVFTQLTSGLLGERAQRGHRRGDRGAHQGAHQGADQGADQGEGSAGGAGASSDAPPDGAMAPMVLSQLIDGLTGLQRGRSSAATSLGIDPTAVDTRSSDLLRSLGASPLLRWLQPNDAATIELVAMLFDCMFSDGELPNQLQEEIGKLQVPILKAALLNKAFFSDQGHPARRLLDVIAAGARGWSGEEQEALLKRIRAAIDNVLASFDDDTAVLNTEVEQIEAVLRAADQKARSQVGELVKRLEQRDRKVVVQTLVADQIDRRRDGQTLPPPVAAFIDEHWRELLGRIYIRYGDASDDWRDALATLEALIWSVQPKHTPEERNRLMHMLPSLLEKLPAWLARLGRADAWQPFLRDLMPLHMAAVRQPEAAAAASPDAADAAAPDGQTQTASTDAHAPPAAERTSAAAADATSPDSEDLPWLMDAGADVEPDSTLVSAPAVDAIQAGQDGDPAAARDADADAGTTSAQAAVDQYLEAARQVAVGDWLEVQQLGSPNLSLRASWISRRSGIMLFADRRGRNARVLSAERLAQALRQGSARLLSRDPLTDRAVARLLLSAAPAETSSA
ncbi:MAG: DUF1631 family protein [Gammaproteobacteria bacterium]|jgi:hypothetical protein|nr:DUF1631 family protein [Gammaproteobacteria bacterium]